MNILKVGISLLLIIAIAGCVSTGSQLESKTIEVLKSESGIGDYNYDLKVLHDNEYNVTCWYIDSGRIGTVGFSCIADSQLNVSIR